MASTHGQCPSSVGTFLGILKGLKTEPEGRGGGGGAQVLQSRFSY